MKRTWQFAGALVIFLLLVGVVYVADPRLLKSQSQLAGGQSATVSESAIVSATRGGSGVGGQSASVTVGASVTASSQGGSTSAEAWTTYHGDNARDGYVPTSNFTSVSPGWTSPTLDGAVYAEPLFYGGDVFVATENNSVYDLSAGTGAVVWRTNLGEPVDGNQLQCGDISPSGITGTPVIDPSTGTLYVVYFGAESVSHTLAAIDVSTGAVLWRTNAEPSGFDVTVQQQRSALSLANGMVYIPYGGLDGDCGQYYGWVVGIPANGTGGMDVYKVPTGREGGIWAPSGAAVDSSGQVYVATGNGASITTFDHGDSVIKLSPSLSEEAYFAPTNWSVLNQDDVDLGSVGPAIVGTETLFQIGKEGVGYLLNSSDLGGIGGQTFEASICQASFGGTAFASPYVLVPCVNGLFEVELSGGGFTAGWHSSNYDAGPPIVTGGVVWAVDLDSSVLYGYSLATGNQLYSFPLGGVERFTTPAAGDGQVFVAADDRVMSFVLG